MNHLDEQLVGLPRYGVTLSGSPENPIIENRSGKTVIGYVVMPGAPQLLALSVAPPGLHDGDSLYANGAVPVNSTVSMLRPFQARGIGRGIGGRPIVRAILTSVIFADGQFVGPDEHGIFEEFGMRMKAIREVGILAKTQAWDQVEALALQIPPRIPDGEDHAASLAWQAAALKLSKSASSLQLLPATLLAQERKFKGDAAAPRLAEIYSSLPTLWK